MLVDRLVQAVRHALPDAPPEEILRLAYVVSVEEESSDWEHSGQLKEHLVDLRVRLRDAAEQLELVETELADLAKINPCRFEPQQIWSLFRSINAQRQLIGLYRGQDRRPRRTRSHQATAQA